MKRMTGCLPYKWMEGKMDWMMDKQRYGKMDGLMDHRLMHRYTDSRMETLSCGHIDGWAEILKNNRQLKGLT